MSRLKINSRLMEGCIEENPTENRLITTQIDWIDELVDFGGAAAPPLGGRILEPS
ncbi:MAG TPA: hypothetical protein VH280_19870 [Verrucomicrobiae bacterium]|jgi:hypothetical protein|nr:hypothetical protein [Verrucomicrobiae bacterium]